MNKIDEISIQGFKSIRSLDKLQLNNLNVLIGANGVDKSNFVSYFRMLHELVEGRLQVWTSKQGDADRVLSYGVKETQKLHTTIRFGVTEPNLGAGHKESNLKKEMQSGTSSKVASFCYSAISAWKVFHFHDTSDTAAVKRLGAVHD